MEKLFCFLSVLISMTTVAQELNTYFSPMMLPAWLPTAQYAPEEKWNPNKSMADAMIELFYQNPEAVAVMNENCKNITNWEAVFTEDAHLSNRAIQCLTWEMNKRLSPEQQEALTWIKNPFNHVFFQLELDSPGSSAEFECELVGRLYNIVMQKNLPECAYEVNSKSSLGDEPCNSSGSIKTLCYNQKDIVSCMKKKLVEMYAELSFTVFHKKDIAKTNEFYAQQKRELIDETRYREESLNYMTDLLEKTEKMMELIVPEKKKREKELIKMFNFYELVMLFANRKLVNYKTDGGLYREEYWQD